jgi:hypothetical protein
MALTPEDSDKLRKQLQEIERLSSLLNKNINTASLQNLEQSADQIRAIFAALNDEFNDFTGDIGYAANGFKKLVQEITNSNIGVKETTKAFNKLSSIAERIQSYQKGFSDLTTKDVKKLREQFNIEKQRLENAQDILKDKKDLLEAETANLTIQRNIAIQAGRAAQAAGDRTAHSMAISQARSLENRIRRIGVEYNKASGALAANTALLEEQDVLLKGLDTTIKQTNEDLKNQNQLLGLGGAIIGGLQEGLNKLGFGGLARQLGIDEANEKMKAFSKRIVDDRKKELALMADIAEANVNNYTIEELRNGVGGDILRKKQQELDTLNAVNSKYEGINGKIAVLKEGVFSMGEALIENLTDPLTLATFAVTQLVDALKSVDTGAGQMAKDLNLSYTEASGLRDELNTIANLSMDSAINTQGLQESYTAISKTLGVNADINKEDLETFTKLREQAGYTNEELIAINKISMGTGKSVEDTVSGFFAGAKALSTQKGVAINVKQLLKETANVSNAIKLSLGGSTEALGKAAAQAKAVGMNLEQADRIASSLLNFEDSISAELEAELLTGKNINLEKARLAAINGDIGTVAEEINKQLGGSAEFTKMNRLQQEAMAKAVGMTREELANSLVEQEALQRTGFKTAEAAKARYEELRKTMSAEEAAAALGDEELAKQYEQQSVQEKFNQTVEKLKEIFVSAATALMPVFDIFVDIFKVVGAIAGPIGQIVKWTIELGKVLAPIYGIYKAIQAIQTAQLYIALSKRDVELFGLDTIKKELVVKEGMSLQDKLQLGYRRVILFLANSEYRTEVLTNIQKSIGNKLTKLGNLFKKGGLIYDIGSAAVSAISATMSFLGKFLGPFAIPAAIAAGALVAGAAYKYLPGLKDGGTVVGDGSVMVGEQGPEVLSLKPGATVTPLSKVNAASERGTSDTAILNEIRNLLQQIASSPGVVELDGTLVGKVLTPLINTENLTTSVKTQ